MGKMVGIGFGSLITFIVIAASGLWVMGERTLAAVVETPGSETIATPANSEFPALEDEGPK